MSFILGPPVIYILRLGLRQLHPPSSKPHSLFQSLLTTITKHQHSFRFQQEATVPSTIPNKMYKFLALASILACTSAALTAPGPEESITTLPGHSETITSLPGHSETITSLPGHSETVPDSPTETPSTTLPIGSGTPPWWSQSPTPGWSTSRPIGSGSLTPCGSSSSSSPSSTGGSGGDGPAFTGAAGALYKAGTIYAVAGGVLVGFGAVIVV